MSTIPQDQIDRIKANYPIRSVVSRWIELDAKGRACCPFHQEKNASFKVSEEGFYKCFGCGAGGDVISFVQNYKVVSFKEAREIITRQVIEPERKGFRNGRIIMLSDRMAEQSSEDSPKPAPKKSTNRFNALWEAKVNNFTDEHADAIAQKRGLDGRIFRWLRENKLVGPHDNTYVAFPVHDEAGNVVRCHVKNHDKDTWTHEPQGGSEKSTQSLVIGEPAKAKTTFVLESQWDAFAIMSALQHWDHETDYAYVITRGASSNTDVSKHVTSHGRTILIPQNDPEDKKDSTGKTPAEKWPERCKAGIPASVTAYVANTPEGFKDPNDWIAQTAPSGSDVKKHFTELLHTSESNLAIRPLEFECIHHDDISDTEGAFDFVEDFFTDGASSIVYGLPNDGKTFFMLDLGAHVATGREWQGKEVEQGAVIYIALEGKKGAENRIKAMKMRGILPKSAPFFLCFSPVNLLDPKHPEAIKRMIGNQSAIAGINVRLVIIDTMARAMAGGDENSGVDMGKALETIDTLRKSTGAHICIIHHCGKDPGRGARGHSSLKGAIDTEIEVFHPEGEKYRTATVIKQRDLEKIPPLCFSLEVVELGLNRRGKTITSCVVKAEDGIMAHVKGKAGAKPKYNSKMLLDLLPQPTIRAWQAAAKEFHNMGKDAFDDHKGKCASQWKKTNRGVIRSDLESLLDIERGGNGGN